MTPDHRDPDDDPTRIIDPGTDPDAEATRVIDAGGSDAPRRVEDDMPGWFRPERPTPAADAVADPAPDAAPTAVLPEAGPDAATSPVEELDTADEPSRRGRGGRIAAWVLAGLVVLLGGAYLAGHFAAGDKVPAKTTVAGVAIGGLSAGDAEAKLRTELADEATAPITVTAGGKKVEIRPAESGLGIDYAGTVAESGVGNSWNPATIFRVLRGGGPVEPVVAKDDAAFTVAMTDLERLNTKAKDAAIAYEGTKVKLTKAVSALVVDPAKTGDAVEAAYLGADDPVEAVATVTDADITTAEAEQVVQDVAKPAVAKPIKVDTGKGSFEVKPAMIAGATTFEKADGTLAAKTDAKKLYKLVAKEIDALGLAKGKDARIVLSNGKPTIIPSKDGLGIKADDLAKGIASVITKTDDRTVKVEAKERPAEFSTADAKKLGVKEITGSFTTNFPHADYRNNNLSRAAASINGTFLKPGETFSLNSVLGERTRANGYVDGYVIMGAKLVKEPGGGVSQSATTTYNAAFFAGLEDVEHHPHTKYFPRYPAGREATVYYGSLDLRFRNNTKYGVLMQAWVNKSTPGSQGSITVRVWSTKIYTVKSSTPVKSNFTTGRDIKDNSPGCEPQAPAQGFDVRYQRLFYQGGSLVKTEKYFWRYSPLDRIICT